MTTPILVPVYALHERSLEPTSRLARRRRLSDTALRAQLALGVLLAYLQPHVDAYVDRGPVEWW